MLRTLTALFLCAGCATSSATVSEPAEDSAPPDAGTLEPQSGRAPEDGGSSEPPPRAADVSADAGQPAAPAEPAAARDAGTARVDSSARGDAGSTAPTTTPAKSRAKATLDSRAPVDPSASAADIWKSRCSACHGKDGSAETKIGKEAKIPDFRSPAWKSKHSDDAISKDIVYGAPDTKMKSYEGKMTARQLAELVQLIRSL